MTNICGSCYLIRKYTQTLPFFELTEKWALTLSEIKFLLRTCPCFLGRTDVA